MNSDLKKSVIMKVAYRIRHARLIVFLAYEQYLTKLISKKFVKFLCKFIKI